jgi:hypothetical protein
VFGEEGNIFRIYYSIDEFLLEFLMVITTVTLRAPPSPTYAFRHAAGEANPAVSGRRFSVKQEMVHPV